MLKLFTYEFFTADFSVVVHAEGLLTAIHYFYQEYNAFIIAILDVESPAYHDFIAQVKRPPVQFL